MSRGGIKAAAGLFQRVMNPIAGVTELIPAKAPLAPVKSRLIVTSAKVGIGEIFRKYPDETEVKINAVKLAGKTSVTVDLGGHKTVASEEKDAMSEIAKALTRRSNIRSLAFEQNSPRYTEITDSIISGEDIALITEAAAGKSLLRNLDFSGLRDYGDELIPEMAKLFKKVPDLRVLRLENSVIEDGGAKAVAKYLERGDSFVTHFMLEKCRMNPAGVAILLKAFEKNIFVKYLFLDLYSIQPSPNRSGEAYKSYKEIDINSADLIKHNSSITLFKFGEMYHANEAVRRAVTDYALTVLMPRLIMAINAAPEIKEKLQEERDKVIASRDYEQIERFIKGKVLGGAYYESELVTAVYKYFLNGLNHQEIRDFAKVWNSPLAQIHSKLLKDYKTSDYKEDQWQSLFGDKKEITIEEIPDYSFRAITSSEGLKSEGRKLKHCIGGYTKDCVISGRHVVSILDKKTGESLSTMCFNVDYAGKKLILKEHKSYDDKIPNAVLLDVAANFLEQVNSGKIVIDYEAVEKSHRERNDLEPDLIKSVADLIGFDPLNKGKRREIYSTFKTDITPPELKEKFKDLAKDPIEIDLGEAGLVVLPPLVEVVRKKSSSRKIVPITEAEIEEKRRKTAEMIPNIQNSLDQLFQGRITARIEVLEEGDGKRKVVSFYSKDQEFLEEEFSKITQFRKAGGLIPQGKGGFYLDMKPKDLRQVLEVLVKKRVDISGVNKTKPSLLLVDPQLLTQLKEEKEVVSQKK